VQAVLKDSGLKITTQRCKLVGFLTQVDKPHLTVENIYKGAKLYRATQGTAICKLFDMAIASTGLNEKNLLRQAIPFAMFYVHTTSHASYYPGAHLISLKLLFCPKTGRILGAQAAGLDGVDKRIDVLAVT
jgi:NADPH-dependent 2,4-dienoyl-CoA reductase/sulfur reductase-like enzyme